MYFYLLFLSFFIFLVHDMTTIFKSFHGRLLIESNISSVLYMYVHPCIMSRVS